MTVLISLKLLASSPTPYPVEQEIHLFDCNPIHHPGTKRTRPNVPLYKLSTFCQPGFITTAVCPSPFTVINNIGHQPFVSLTKDRRAIYFMVIILRATTSPYFQGVFASSKICSIRSCATSHAEQKAEQGRYHAKRMSVDSFSLIQY